MLKNILNLEGAQQLSKNEQKEIIAGKPPVEVCGGEDFITNINSCLCENGGIFDVPTQLCSNGLSYNTYFLFECGTNCCYTNM